MEMNEHAVFQQNFIYGLKYEFHIIFHMSQNMFSFDFFDHLTMYKSFLAHNEKLGSGVDMQALVCQPVL